jgi:predicted acyltransferase
MRLFSLDILRGATVIGMIVVNSAAAVHYGAHAAVAPLLLHASWDGLTLADLVFPGFLTMVGVAIPFSLRREVSAGARGRILARAARLVLLGFLLSNLHVFAQFAAGPWRLFGVLQRIGLVYAAAALLYLAAGPRARLALAAVLLLGYWPLAALPPLDGGTTDLWVRGGNFIASVDRLLLGAHRYVAGPQGYDPEGLLGTLPAIAQALIGVAIGERLRRGAGARDLAVAGAAMLAVGAGWGRLFPIVKDIWSSPFVLVTSGLVALALALLHAAVDRAADGAPAPPRGAATPFTDFGTNAIAAYTLHQLTAPVVTWDLLLVPFRATRAPLGDPLAALLPIALYLLLLWYAMAWLRRRDWVVRI